MRRATGAASSCLGARMLLAVVVAVVIAAANAEHEQCPVECSCLGNVVICKDLQLVGAPNGLPPWTENLILKGNNFANLEFSALLHLPKLQELDVNSNVLGDNFTLSLSKETQLKRLKINKNRLTRIPDLSLAYLTHMAISHNMISKIDKTALIKYPELQSLDLSGNKISSIQTNSFVAPKLKNLNLNSNQIEIVEADAFEKLASLQELRLSKNRLSTLKDFIKKLDKLRILEVNRNEIRSIEALTFAGMKSLEMLQLKRNKIKTLNDGAFWELSNLTELQLDFNQLRHVPKGALFGLHHLQVFSLSHNKISTIDPEAWEMCKEVVELDLSHNELNRIERSSLTSLGKLKKLRLDHNSIVYIAEGAFKDLVSLNELELKSNKLSYVVEDAIGIFVPLMQLKKLGMAHNQIKSINKNAFNGLSQVTELDLIGNNITSIQENAFSSMASTLTNLKLNTTSLFCDCGLQWLSIWLRTKRFSDTKAQCGYPHWLRGMSLTQLHHVNFTCDEFPKPRIIEEPESKLSIRGDSVRLRCRASSTADAPLSFIWKHDNVELRERSLQNDSEPSSADGVTIATSELLLSNVSNAHGGKYQCMVSNSYGTTYSAKAKISVLVYPWFTKVPQDIRVSAGSTARLECSADGHPTPQIAWQKDGGNDFPAARERRMHKMPTDDVLFIIDAKAADTGVYSCIAQNLAGVITVNATLTILETPSFVKPMESKEAIAGENIVMECMASGSPRPQLSWSKNGSPLKTTERHFFTAENQLLVIVHTVTGDAGNYECKMSNSLGTVTGSSQLTIKAAPSSIMNEEDILGLIIITVVFCAVGTSVVWVVIIYQTRKRLNSSRNRTATDGALITARKGATSELETHIYLDTSSQHSKDSGTGDSTNPSNDQLQICLPGAIARPVNNIDDPENVASCDPLLRYTNHERQSYKHSNHDDEISHESECH